MENRLNSDFLEKIILKGMLTDRNFLVLVSGVYEPEFFDDPNIRYSFKFCKEYADQYHQPPPKEAIINSHEETDEIREVIEQAEQTDFNITENYDFLIEQTNDYLKEKAIKQAIIDSVDDVEDVEKRAIIQKRIEDALMKDINIDLGLNYFEDIGVRLRRIFTASDTRIPTYFPVFDELINGGFPALTFSVLTAKIHGGKSNTMANFAARQVLNGHNVVLLTLEMSQDAFAQRFDSIMTGLDMNRIYSSREYKSRLMSNLRRIKESNNLGNLFIKQYPTGSASILDFRIYLRELAIRNFPVDIVYVDYINLMKPSYITKGSMYQDVKRISEELRALSFEFKCPFISVSQLNREGFFTTFEEIDFNHTAESMGIPATADFMAVLGVDQSQMVYESEVLYKITKNRMGGRVGEIEKFYLDKRSLKMYDSSELDLWIEEATISGDNRERI